MSKFTTGQVYYGETLRRILAPRQDSWRDLFRSHEFWIGVFGVILLAASIALIVLGGPENL